MVANLGWKTFVPKTFDLETFVHGYFISTQLRNVEDKEMGNQNPSGNKVPLGNKSPGNKSPGNKSPPGNKSLSWLSWEQTSFLIGWISNVQEQKSQDQKYGEQKFFSLDEKSCRTHQKSSFPFNRRTLMNLWFLNWVQL